MAENAYSKRAVLNKKMKREAAQSYGAARRLKREAEAMGAGSGHKTKRVKNERPATAAKREQKAFYGKFNPANPICPKCFTIMSASGECAGACFE